MKICHSAFTASIVGAVFLFAAGANGATVTFSTNAPGTGFAGFGLILSNTLGASATLTFAPGVNVSTGVPSNVNFGNFTLVCSTCSTQAGGSGSTFAPFTFHLVITDVTDGATGLIVGTSSGGAVFSDVSQISINWAPLQLGPGANQAATGNFGPTVFTTTGFTGIVAPNSGAIPGQSTVQGFVDTVISDDVPEPITMAMVGSALLGLGLLRKKRLTRQ